MASDESTINQLSVTVSELTNSIQNLKELVTLDRNENKDKLTTIVTKIDNTATAINQIKQELVRIDVYISKIDRLEKEVEDLKIQKNKMEGALSLLRILGTINVGGLASLLAFLLK